jgi:hypothetical protein
LVSSLIGIALRSTMDIDATVKNVSLNESDIRKAIEEIIAIRTDGSVSFSLESVSSIMEGMDYPGVRIHLDSHLGKTAIPLLIDLSAGDVITLKEADFAYPKLFGGTIPLFSYNIKTLLAEKIETVFSWNGKYANERLL